MEKPRVETGIQSIKGFTNKTVSAILENGGRASEGSKVIREPG
jgi:hypothetical protein